MKIQKFGFIAVALSLAGTPALADDAHHADHGATAAKPAAAPKSDAQPPAAVVEAAVAAKDEASAKPAPRKHKRKKQKAEAKPAESGKQQDAAHADAGHTDAHAVPVPAPVAPAARVRVKSRAAAASAVAAAQAADAQSDPAASADPAAPDSHASHHAATTDAPAAAAAPQDAHDAHDAPPVPAAIEPTRRARVKGSMAAMPAPVAAPVSVVEATTADAHEAANMAEASAPAKTDAIPDAAPAVAETRAADECNPPLKGEVAALFDRWNASLRTGDPKKVVANYAPDSVLLPTVSNRARFTVAEKEDYFMHFLQRRPQGYIDDRMIDVDCNSATDAGLYTFRFADGTSVKARYSFAYRKINGQWLITSHHSSGMPEKPEAPVAHSADPQPVAKSAESGTQNKGWVRFP